MSEFPSINDFIIEGKGIALEKEAEHKIIQYMEDYVQSVENDETEAFYDACSIVLNC